MTIVLVTGTYGKTTTTRCISAALGNSDDLWLKLNANTRICVPISLLKTPPWRRAVAIEFGIARPGRMAHTARLLRPDIVISTCVGQEHIQSFRNMDHLADEKTEAVKQLKATGWAILNRDDPRVWAMRSKHPGKTRSFGFHKDADVRALDWSQDWPDGGVLKFEYRDQHYTLPSQLSSRLNTTPLLAALAVGSILKIPLADMIERLSKLPPSPGRMQRMALSNGAWLLGDEGKSTIQTVETAIDFLKSLNGVKRTLVLSGLSSPPGKKVPSYRAIATQAASAAERIIVVGIMRKYYLPTLRKAQEQNPDLSIESFARVGEVSEFLIDNLKAGEVVMLKGRATEKLERITLRLQNVPVRCNVFDCEISMRFCEECSFRMKPSGGRGAL